MRKEQQKLLDKTDSWGESAVSILKKESLTIKELKCWYNILKWHSQENLDSELVRKLQNLVGKLDAMYMCRFIPMSLAEFCDIYEGLRVEHDFRSALDIASLYSEFRFYQDVPECSLKAVKALYVSKDQSFLECSRCYSEYFERHLYTGDNISNIIRSEKIRNQYFTQDESCEFLLHVENGFSDDELDAIDNDNDCTSIMRQKLYLYQFKRHFPDTFKMLQEYYQNDNYTTEENLYNYLSGSNSAIIIMEPDKVTQIEKILDFAECDNDLTVELAGVPRFLRISFSLRSFSLEYGQGNAYIGRKSIYGYYNGRKIYALEPKRKFKLLFYYEDDHVYTQTWGGKWIPCPYQDFLNLKESKSEIFTTFFDEYLKLRIEKGNYIWKDIIRHDYYKKKCLPPFKMDELNKYGSFDKLMKAKYKHADFVNWNKCDIQWCYMIMQMLPKINDNSKNLLLSLKYDRGFEYIRPQQQKDKNYLYTDVFVKFIIDRITSSNKNEYTEQLILDYLFMCKMQHKKINLCFRSEKKIKEVHDELLKRVEMKNIPKITIPKTTKFRELDKILPENFEKITTRNRIVKEGMQQNNCVATYADKINQDECAIYSLLYGEIRYTLEFGKKNGNYFIRQLYAANNKKAQEEIWKYVESVLKQPTTGRKEDII